MRQEGFELKNRTFTSQVPYLSTPPFTVTILERGVYDHCFHFCLRSLSLYSVISIFTGCPASSCSSFRAHLKCPQAKKQKQQQQQALFLGSCQSREEDPETTRKAYEVCLLGAETEGGRDKAGWGHKGGRVSRRPHKLPSSCEPDAARFPSQSAQE